MLFRSVTNGYFYTSLANNPEKPAGCATLDVMIQEEMSVQTREASDANADGRELNPSLFLPIDEDDQNYFADQRLLRLIRLLDR